MVTNVDSPLSPLKYKQRIICTNCWEEEWGYQPSLQAYEFSKSIQLATV